MTRAFTAPHAPPRLAIPPTTVPVGGFIVRGRADDDPRSARTRVLLECSGCGAVEPRAVYYLIAKPSGCRACVAKRRYGT